VTTHNRSLLALAADYGGATRQDLIADLDRQVAALDRQISDAEESLDGNGWPEIATELSFLEGKRAELESQRADLELVEVLDVLKDYAVVDGIHTFYRR
jgi:hypothetical protein